MNMDEKIRQAFENATPDVLDSVLSDCSKQKGVAAMNENKKMTQISKIVSTAAILVLLVGISAAAVSVIGSGFTLNPSARPSSDDPVISGGSTDGTGQDTVNIAPETALAIALEHAGLREGLVSNTQVDVDTDDRTPHYDVSFCDGQYDYEYEIDHISGQILEYEKEPCENGATGNTVGPMTNDEAIEYALRYTGFGRDDVTNLTCERDDDDEVWRYDVEFVADGTKYDCTINAVTGELLELEKEPADGTAQGGNNAPATDAAQRAVEAALAEVTWTMDDINDLNCELDDDSDEVPHYDIEFVAGGVEYDIEVHAETFEILKVEKEVLDDIVPDPEGALTQEEAVEQALENRGFTRDEVTELSCEVEVENDVTVYEIEFEADGVEYVVKVCDTPSGIQIIGGIDD